MSETRVRKCPCGDPFCRSYTLSTQGSVGFSFEDATLYAAAEDLLKCAQILASLDDGRGRSFPTVEQCEFARQTVAKARGI